MNDRVIVVFPALADSTPIDQLRERFDPQARLVRPHLTLVFPFEDAISTEALRDHLRTAAEGIRPFPVRLQGVTGSEQEYLFLNVKRGNDELIALHDRLYTGPLRKHLRRDHTFTPHLTVGRIIDPVQFLPALQAAVQMDAEFETVVTDLSVYTIHPGGRRETELTFPLVR